jgi:hypothetical protein
MKVVLIACASAIVATVLFSGIYSPVPSSSGPIFVVNRYTGSVTFCLPSYCKELLPPPPPPPPPPPLASFKSATGVNFDVAAARKDGVSDADIATFLAGKPGFNIDAARKAGYSDTEIVNYLALPSPGAGDPRAKPH